MLVEEKNKGHLEQYVNGTIRDNYRNQQSIWQTYNMNMQEYYFQEQKSQVVSWNKDHNTDEQSLLLSLSTTIFH